MSENRAPLSPASNSARDSVIRCLGLIICSLFVWMLFDKCTGKHSDKSPAIAAKETRFKYIFDGTYTSINGYQFQFDDFVRDIFAGNISDDMLGHCLIYPSKTYRKSNLALKQVLNDFLLFECREYRETYLFALKRDSFCEPRFKRLFSIVNSVTGGFTDYFPDEAIAFDGWANFQTVGGFVRNLPVFTLVPNPPSNKPPPVQIPPKDIPPKDIRATISPEQYQREISALLNELLTFKDSGRFFQHGIGPLGYPDWKKQYDTLNSSKFSWDCNTSALTCILELVEEYRRTRGRESERTKVLRDGSLEPLR